MMYTVPKGTLPNKDTIKNAIDFNEAQRPRFQNLDNYYQGKHSILKRDKITGLKNNKVVVNHAKYITDINVGYLLGNEVEYQIKDKEAENQYDISLIIDQYKKQTIADLDNEIAKTVSKMGKAFELVFANEKNEIRSKLVDPRNCIIVYDDTVDHNKLFAITYTSRKSDTEYVDVKTYTDTQIQEWNAKLIAGSITPHKFQEVPVIEYRNNPEEQGDYEQVISLIDAYNTLQSDRVNDKEQLVEAILVIYGATMTEEDKAALRESRVMYMGSQIEGEKVEYLVKQLQETESDVLVNKIEGDIHKISMTPNLSDQNFVGNASGVAIRYKLIAFEQSVVNKERYFERGLKRRIVLYNNYLRILENMQEIPPYEVDAVFKRNLPQNDVETSTIINQLDGKVSDKTLISQLSFIEDAEMEIEKARSDAQDRAKRMAEQFGNFGVNPDSGGDQPSN